MNRSSSAKKLSPPSHCQVIRPKQLPEVVGFTAATARRLEIQGKFPRRRRVGLQGVGWLRSELDEYLANQETVYVTENGQKVGTVEARQAV